MPFYLLLGLIAVVGAGVLAYQLLGFGQDEAALEPVPVLMDPATLAQAQGITAGPEDAPVVIFEFADFQCPACAQFATFVSPLVKERFVQPGMVRYVFYDYPLTSIHPHAFIAARAGRCANDQNRFWEYHDVLFGRQPRWSSVRNPTGLFVDYAVELGLNQAEFEACLRSDRHAEEVTRNMRLGESLGVPGTPTIFVNGKRLPQPPSFRELEQIIHEEAGTDAAADTVAPAVTPDHTGRRAPGIP